MLNAVCRGFSLWGLVVCVVATGCVDGPFGGFPAINPFLKQQWEKDEQFGPTFHRRLADFRGLRATGGRLEQRRKEELAADLTRVLATETNAVLRAEIAQVLGELATAESVSGLRATLADPDKDVRMAACRAFAKIGGPEAVQVMSEMMERESDIDVRLVIISELGRFQDQTAIAVLGRALDDRDPAVQHLAVQSLKSASGRDYGDSVPAWRDFVQGREPPTTPVPSLAERMTSWF